MTLIFISCQNVTNVYFVHNLYVKSIDKMFVIYIEYEYIIYSIMIHVKTSIFFFKNCNKALLVVRKNRISTK